MLGQRLVNTTATKETNTDERDTSALHSLCYEKFALELKNVIFLLLAKSDVLQRVLVQLVQRQRDNCVINLQTRSVDERIAR